MHALQPILTDGKPVYDQLRRMLDFILKNGLGDAQDLNKRLTNMVNSVGKAATRADVGVLLDNLQLIRAMMDTHVASMAARNANTLTLSWLEYSLLTPTPLRRQKSTT